MTTFLRAALLLLFSPSLVSATCTGPRTPGQLREVLWGAESGYDRYTRPGVAAAAANETLSDPFMAPPDTARVQLHVLSLTDVDQKKNEFTMNVWFRRRWNDWRLRYIAQEDGGCFSSTGREGWPEQLVNEVWRPDFFVENQAEDFERISGSFWVQPNGDVVWVTHMIISLACKMDFSDFPHDVQNCGFRIGTFLEDASDVVLDFWTNLDPVTLASASAGLIPHGGTDEWDMTDAQAVLPEAGSLHGATQSESSVELTFELTRRTDYYSDFVILPAIMFVLIGWSSFFVSRQQAPARVTMSIVGFLANTNFLAAQLGQLPRLGNDVFLLKFLSLSTLFSFYAVIEYVICNHLWRIERRIEQGRVRAKEYVIARDRLQRKGSISNGQAHYSMRERDRMQDDSDDSESSRDPPGLEEGPRTYCTADDDNEATLEEQFDKYLGVKKKDFIASGFKYKLDVWLLKDNGKMRFRDQNVDIFSRYAYPIAYAVMYTVVWLK